MKKAGFEPGKLTEKFKEVGGSLLGGGGGGGGGGGSKGGSSGGGGGQKHWPIKILI